MLWAHEFAGNPFLSYGSWSLHLNDFHPGPLPMQFIYAVAVKSSPLLGVTPFAVASFLLALFYVLIALFSLLMIYKARGSQSAWVLGIFVLLVLSRSDEAGLPFVSPWVANTATWLSLGTACSLIAVLNNVRWAAPGLLLFAGLLTHQYKPAWLFSCIVLLYAIYRCLSIRGSQRVVGLFLVALLSLHPILRTVQDGLWFLDIAPLQKRFDQTLTYTFDNLSTIVISFLPLDTTSLPTALALFFAATAVLLPLGALFRAWRSVRPNRLPRMAFALLWLVSTLVASAFAGPHGWMLHWLQILYLVAFAALVPQGVGNLHHFRTVAFVLLTAVLSFQLFWQPGGVPRPLASPEFESFGFMADDIDVQQLANGPVVVLDNRQENDTLVIASRLIPFTLWLRAQGLDACILARVGDVGYDSERAFPCRADHPAVAVVYRADKRTKFLELVNAGDSPTSSSGLFMRILDKASVAAGPNDADVYFVPPVLPNLPSTPSEVLPEVNRTAGVGPVEMVPGSIEEVS
jgi:hypothetical protein